VATIVPDDTDIGQALHRASFVASCASVITESLTTSHAPPAHTFEPTTVLPSGATFSAITAPPAAPARSPSPQPTVHAARRNPMRPASIAISTPSENIVAASTVAAQFPAEALMYPPKPAVDLVADDPKPHRHRRSPTPPPAVALLADDPKPHRHRRSPTPPPLPHFSMRLGSIISLQGMECPELDGCDAVIVARTTPKSWRVRLLAPVPILPFALPPTITITRSQAAAPDDLRIVEEPLANPTTCVMTNDTAAMGKYSEDSLSDGIAATLPDDLTCHHTPSLPATLNGPAHTSVDSTPPRSIALTAIESYTVRVDGSGRVASVAPLSYITNAAQDYICRPHASFELPAPPRRAQPKVRERTRYPTFSGLPHMLKSAPGPLRIGDIVRLRHISRSWHCNEIGGDALSNCLGLVTAIHHPSQSATVLVTGSPRLSIATHTRSLERLEQVPVHKGVAGAVAGALPRESDDELPPPWGAGYIVDKALDPSQCSRLLFKVDSGCDPFDIISEAFLPPGTVTEAFHTTLTLADGVTTVSSDRIAPINLLVTIADRPRMFCLRPVVWPANRASHPLLISQTTAAHTGLSLFVHDNDLRRQILGTTAFSRFATPNDNPANQPPSIVASIGESDDAELMERISPIEGYRAAMEEPTLTDDAVVNELMHDKVLGPIFGPLPPEPADIDYLEFDLDMEKVSKMTYGTTQTIKCGSSSKRNRDVLDAQFSELYAGRIMAPAFPTVPPQPIASVAFPVPKPGVSRPARPSSYDLPVESLSDAQRDEHKAYEASLTLDRLVVNHQCLNEVMIIQHYPVPSVQENLHKLSSFRYFAKIDITKAYWSIGLHERCRKYTYTIAAGGHAAYWLRAPMGCSAVGGYFQWALDGVLRDARAFTAIYADDIQVGANTKEELNARVRMILKLLLDRGFRISAKKCQLTPSTSTTYLGWILSNGSVMPSPSTLDKLWNIKKPSELLRAKPDAKRKLLKRFLGLINYLAHYLPFTADALRPLHDLTRSRHDDTFVWTPAADAAWDAVIERMKHIVPLHTPSYAANSWLEVYTDASSTGWGGLLVERRAGDPKPYLVQCVAGSFVAAQLNWATIQQEVYGVWATVKRLRPFLWNTPFILNMDHRNLLWSAQSTNPLVQRLATDLQCYRFVMKHVDGETSNVVADWISRATYHDSAESPCPTTAPLDAHAASPITPRHVASVTDSSHAVKPPTSDHHSFSDFEPILCSDSDSDESDDSCDDFSDTAIKPLSGSFLKDLGTSQPLVPTHPASHAAPLAPSTPDPDPPDPFPDPEPMPYPFFLPPVASAPFLPPSSGLAMPVTIPLQSAIPNDILPDLPATSAQQPPPSPPPIEAPAPGKRRRARSHFHHPAINEDDGGPIPFIDGSAEHVPVTYEHHRILKQFHGGASGHSGLSPLLAALAEAGHSWPSIRSDAAHFLATCHHCQLERLTRRAPFPLPYRSLHIPSTLFDTIHLDILGPFPVCSLSGSRYIMIAVDEASKFHFLGHSIDCSSAELVFFLLDCFKLIGLPKTIKSDRGAALISRSLREFCDSTGIQHVFGVAHNHQSDGTIENAAKGVNSYLRTMVHELRKFAAWTPLLCNVMLAMNSLRRKVLAGASANDLVFGRRFGPMRVLRPEALQRPGNPHPDDPRAPVALNTFLADNAALQLQLLAAADDERHNRINDLCDAFHGDHAASLDWTRVGQLVSIPQPEHESRLRPGKFDLRRRGPYEIVRCDPDKQTVHLRDSKAFNLLQNPIVFQWPKRWLWPYHAATFPADPTNVVAPPEEPAPAPRRPDLATPVSAILSSRPLPVAVTSPSLHVANHEFLCRWPDRPHSANRWLKYSDVWSSSAFAEFIVGSPLTGHVPPTAYAAAHRQHILALAHNKDPIPRTVAVDDPQQALHLLQDYVPLESAATAPARQIQASARQFNFLAVAPDESHIPPDASTPDVTDAVSPQLVHAQDDTTDPIKISSAQQHPPQDAHALAQIDPHPGQPDPVLNANPSPPPSDAVLRSTSPVVISPRRSTRPARPSSIYDA